jgi:hypothetical protein
MTPVDPIVEEVRKAGEAYLSKFDFDFEAACKDLRDRSNAAGRQTVSLPPRRVQVPTAAEKCVG